MGINQLLNTIRQSKRRSRLFDALTAEQKRDFVASLEGSDWHLDDLLEDYVEYCREGVFQQSLPV